MGVAILAKQTFLLDFIGTSNCGKSLSEVIDLSLSILLVDV